ncbi:MAG: ribbon-helix-helix domain-containing protein [Alphaproteobacteria bacterium]|nr:ribbon-helix-helix domain-containing protein [Alphaproteobacteria bacterium]
MSEPPSTRYETSLETYSVKVAGRWTTIRLEAELMAALKQVALAEACDIADICTYLAQMRRSGSLTSAIRLYVVQHYRRRTAQRPAPRRDSALAREIAVANRSLLATDERNYVLRHDVMLAQIDERDAGLALLFAYWKALCRGGALPDWTAFELTPLRTVGFDANVHLIDVEAPSPDDYRILRQAPVTQIYRAPANVPLSALGDTLYARELMADYSNAKFRPEPALQQLAVRTSEGALRYDRIILPCAVDGSRIGRLVVGVAPPPPQAPERTSTPG